MLLEFEVVDWSTLSEIPFQGAKKAKWVVAIDAHCEFHETLSIFNALRNRVDSFEGEACLFFVSPFFEVPVPRLDQGGDKDVDSLRLNQFFFRMTESYGWGTFCKKSSFSATFKRVRKFYNEDFLGGLRDGQYSFFGLTLSSIDDWKSDLLRTWDFVFARLKRGPWIDNEGKPGREGFAKKYFRGQTNDNLLDFLAAAHQIGRREQFKAEELLKQFATRIAAPTKSRLPWIGSNTSQAKIRSKISRIEDRSQNLWEKISPVDSQVPQAPITKALMENAELRNILRARSIVLGYLQDLSQNFTKGTAVWARDARADLRRPVRILAIKDYVRMNSPRDRLDRLFSSSFGAGFRPGDIELHCLAPEGERNLDWDTHDWWSKNLNLGNEYHAVKPMRVKSTTCISVCGA